MEINVYPANEFADFWPVEEFNKKYSEQEGIRSCSIASAFNIKNPEKSGLVILRTFIQNGEKAKIDQKYIIGIRFYSFGDMATIDLVSLEKGYHREICYEHLKRMNWPLWSEDMGIFTDHYGETTRAPFLFVGGHLKVSDDNSVKFYGNSGDYGSKLLFSDSNSLANYILSVSGIPFFGEKESGEELVEYLLKFMYENKLKREFYRDLISGLYSREEEIKLTAQNIGALITMKVVDRHILGEGDILQLMVDETSEGLARDIMLQGVAQRVRHSKK